jgi:uncharacterized membrane protein
VKKIILSIFFALALLLTPSHVMAKDYTIESANFDVVINKDGSANVTETRTYNFNGSFSWVDEWIPTKASKITDFTLSEGEEQYFESSSTLAGNYSVTDEGDRVYIKWYYKAQDERKTFTLNYKIQNALINQKDITEFYWQLIGDKWTKGTGEVTAKITLPYPAPANQVWAYGHGPLNGKINITTNTEINFSATDLSPEKFF